jgi:hypothetical protein
VKESIFTAVFITFAIAAACLFLLLAALADSAIARPGGPAITATPSVTPEATLFSDPFSATLTLSSDHSMVSFGESLQVTVDLDVVEGCQYPVVDMTLFQDGENGALFSHVDPPTAVVSAPVSFPFTYHLQAIRAGEVALSAQTFGERNCNDYWNWHYLNTDALAITVSGDVSLFYLPLLTAE